MPEQKQPNVLFFFVDQQRWDTVGAYGQPLAVTPNLDAMAREGVLFRNAFTCQPVCGPARACLQTRKWATEVGMHRGHRASRGSEMGSEKQEERRERGEDIWRPGPACGIETLTGRHSPGERLLLTI